MMKRGVGYEEMKDARIQRYLMQLIDGDKPGDLPGSCHGLFS